VTHELMEVWGMQEPGADWFRTLVPEVRSSRCERLNSNGPSEREILH